MSTTPGFGLSPVFSLPRSSALFPRVRLPLASCSEIPETFREQSWLRKRERSCDRKVNQSANYDKSASEQQLPHMIMSQMKTATTIQTWTRSSIISTKRERKGQKKKRERERQGKREKKGTINVTSSEAMIKRHSFKRSLAKGDLKTLQSQITTQ